MSESAQTPQHLRNIFWHMEHRIKELGLKRFDVSDIPSHPFFLLFSYGKKRYLAYPFRLFEHFFPFYCRRLLGITPTLVPTALSHLGYAYLAARKWDKNDHICDRIIEIAEQAIGLASPYEDTLCWEHPFQSHGAGLRLTMGKTQAMPDSCAHNTVRLGMFLMDAGRSLGNSRYINAGLSAADALMKLHNWHNYEDGSCTVSYYPSTDDEVINTAAEVAVFLANLPIEYVTAEHSRRVEGICRMIIDEQRHDGGWNYQTRNHCKRFHEQIMLPDNHHNAMVLSALARLYSSPCVQELSSELIKAISAGIDYHLDTFCPVGRPPLMLPNSRRFADVAGYCESIMMLLNVHHLPGLLEEQIAERIHQTTNWLVEHALQSLYVPATGDVGCYRRFGTLHNIHSIRWGSGLLMEALSRFLSWEEFVGIVKLQGEQKE